MIWRANERERRKKRWKDMEHQGVGKDWETHWETRKKRLKELERIRERAHEIWKQWNKPKKQRNAPETDRPHWRVRIGARMKFSPYEERYKGADIRYRKRSIKIQDYRGPAPEQEVRWKDKEEVLPYLGKRRKRDLEKWGITRIPSEKQRR